MEALERLERNADVDVIVIARGGGSVEDLLPFSDEALIRVVHRMRTPVVSAIGHEPDQPLLDLVADVRASTPTDAAKLVVPDMAEESRGVLWARDRLRQVITQRVAREQEWLGDLRARPAMADPRNLLTVRSDEVDELRGARPPHALATASTAPPTTSATSARGPRRSRRWPPCSGATPSCRTPTATSSRPSPRPPPAPRSRVRVADGRIARHHDRTESAEGDHDE